jgi:hypothetical protein
VAGRFLETDPGWMGPVRGFWPGLLRWFALMRVWVGFFEYEKGIWWMPWRQEAKKDVARCENLGGAASRR